MPACCCHRVLAYLRTAMCVHACLVCYAPLLPNHLLSLVSVGCDCPCLWLIAGRVFAVAVLPHEHVLYAQHSAYLLHGNNLQLCPAMPANAVPLSRPLSAATPAALCSGWTQLGSAAAPGKLEAPSADWPAEHATQHTAAGWGLTPADDCRRGGPAQHFLAQRFG